MRVIAGRLGGRALTAPRGARTRPTTDRVREALFSILGDLSSCRVLDLYAGSGALGIEALSRGAASVVVVESARPALACIHRNLSLLGVEGQVVVLGSRVERSRDRLAPLGPFDIVFCDPPWAQLTRAVLDVARLLDGGLTREGTRIVIEHPARDRLTDLKPVADHPFERRVYGDTALTLFQVFDES